MKKIIASLFTAALIGGAVNAVSASAAENETADLSAQLLTDDSVSAAGKSNLYTTKDVQSELRLRAEASTSSEIVGTIPPGALITVLSIEDGWASAEYGSSKGYVSTTYIRKITPADSAIAFNKAAYPEWFIPEDAGFKFAGSISSNLVVKRVWGGVYKRDGKTEVLTAEVAPESDQFDTASFLNKSVDITKVGKGSYTYKLFAEDAAGKVTELVSSDFTKLGTSADYSSKAAGDIDGNGKIASADADMLQKYLVGDQKLSTAQYMLADVDRDTYVNAFDLVLLRQSIIDAPDAPVVDPGNGWSDEEAGTYTTKNVNTNLNIRKAADTSADTLGSVPAGAKFKVTQSNKDWAYIEYGSIKGYVSKTYIQKYAEPKTDPEETWSTDDAGIYITKGITTDLNIRETASADAKIIGTIPRSAKFRVTKTSKNWVYVDYKGLNGYASIAQVQKYVEPKTDPEEGWTTDTAGTYTTLNVTDGLNIRAAASTSANILGTIPANAKFSVTKTSKDWAYAEYNGVKGYVSMTYIQKYAEPKTDPEETWSTDDAGIYITKGITTDLNIRETASADAKIIGTIPRSAKFRVTKTSKNWVYVDYKGLNGYASIAQVQKYVEPKTDPEEGWTTDTAGKYTTLNVTDGLNIRAAASTSANILGTIPANAKFSVTKTSKDWAYAEYNGVKGYVSMTYIQKYAEPKTDPEEGWSTDDAGIYITKGLTGNLNVREAPSADAKIIGTIPRSAKFRVTKTSKNWVYVDYKGLNGYASIAQVQKYVEPKTDPEEGWTTDTAGTYTTLNVTDGLNIRTAASTSANILGTIPANAKFSVTKTSKDWAYAEYNGVKGYVSMTYIQKYAEPKTDPEEGWSTDDAGIYITKGLTGNLNVREAPSADAKILGTIPRSAKFNVTKTSKDWVYVDYKGHNGYAAMSDVQKYVELEEGWTATTAGTYTTYNVTDGLNIRAAASTSSDILGSIPAGATFKVTKTSKDWAYAEYIGIKGYVSMSYIQMHDPSNEVSVQLDVMEFNQNPNYPTGCESAALYMLLKYYDVNVTMEQIVKALPKGPLPYYSNGTLYGANPETEFVGDPHNSYAYGVFNEPLAKTAEKFKTGVETKKDSSIDEIIALLKAGKPVVAWYTTSPGKAITYNDSWYDYKTGKLIRWPAGEHAVVVCGFNIAEKKLTYRDPYTGGSRTVSFSMFEDAFNELGGRILYY